ncbi:hypothetical protein HORIV_56220 [Vreelandella olivaria]|uniref:Uncharacterized protein n=1 Tax=Vreelandella olivaria TaxID=390919 RepID=A0ABM7GR45_9GAMM|nr:hypothetical protein HORIV_56220 [Halomonas olivaria]
MPARDRYPHLPKAVEYAHIGWDFFILTLVVINLALLLFDSLFLLGPINQGIANLAPGFHTFYDEVIHSRFITIDLVFVSFFVADVLLGWSIAIAERRYHRWFFTLSCTGMTCWAAFLCRASACCVFYASYRCSTASTAWVLLMLPAGISINLWPSITIFCLRSSLTA